MRANGDAKGVNCRMDIKSQWQSYLLNQREEEARKLGDQITDIIIAAERRAHDASALASRTHDEVALEVKNEHDAENRELKRRLRFCVAELSSEAELDAYNKFVADHEKCRLNSKINGGKMPYVVQCGTGIGTCTKVVCQVCGAEQNITDTSIW